MPETKIIGDFVKILALLDHEALPVLRARNLTNSSLLPQSCKGFTRATNVSNGTSLKTRNPPDQEVTPITQRLFHGFGAILSQTDLVTTKDNEHGVEISLSAFFLQHGLQALEKPDFPDGPEKIHRLQVTAAFLQWAHDGGTMEILPTPSSRTVSLRLGLSSPGNITDPWEILAANLVANDLFWQRHVD